MLAGGLLQFRPCCCQCLFSPLLLGGRLALGLLELPLGSLFLSHLLPDFPLLLLYFLLLHLVLVSKSQFSEAQIQVGSRDRGMHDLTKRINGLKRLSYSFLHLRRVIPYYFGNSCIALAIKGSHHDLRLFSYHAFAFRPTVIHLPSRRAFYGSATIATNQRLLRSE